MLVPALFFGFIALVLVPDSQLALLGGIAGGIVVGLGCIACIASYLL